MLDLRSLRSDPERAAEGLAARGVEAELLEGLLRLDSRHRHLLSRRDGLRHEIKTLSEEVGRLHAQGRSGDAALPRERSRQLGAEAKALSHDADALAEEIREMMLQLPNLPAAECPRGAAAKENPVLEIVGYSPEDYGDHQRVPHWEFSAEQGWLDLERASKLSGSMFVLFRGAGAQLSRALVQLALERNSDLYEEIRPPTLVHTETMISTGHLPKFADDAYHLTRDDLWAIPTGEVPLTSLCKDEILEEEDLPMRMMAHTSCFRREAGAAGRDTRGLLRVHEFDKVEILAYSTPEQASMIHQEILERAASVLAELGLAYRVVDICTGDLGNSSARTFDLEVYSPGVDRWLECSSVSWFSDYQARRANVRYRPSSGGRPSLVHTLNGSALAVPRVWAALTETWRNPDGSVTIPPPLRRYMNGLEVMGGD